jgi:hypothetical protein
MGRLGRGTAFALWVMFSGCGPVEESGPLIEERGSCVLASCGGPGQACGQVDDGCGGTIDCGGCPSGLRCEAGSCVEGEAPAGRGDAPLPAPGWSAELGTAVLGVAVTPGGEVLALWLDGRLESQTLRLTAWSGSGHRLWTRDLGRLDGPVFPHGASLAASATGIYFQLSPVCSMHCQPIRWRGEVLSGSVLVKLSADGVPQWRQHTGGMGLGISLALDGGVAVMSRRPSSAQTEVRRFDARGRLRWHRSLRGAQALDLDGADHLWVGGVDPTRGTYLVRFDRAGAPVLSRLLDGAASRVKALAGTPEGGAIAAVTAAGSFRWAGGTHGGGYGPGAEPGTVFVFLDADGTERTALEENTFWTQVRLASLPGGRWAATAGPCAVLFRYDAGGGKTSVDGVVDACDPRLDSAPAAALAASEELTVVGGAHQRGSTEPAPPSEGYLRVFGN